MMLEPQHVLVIDDNPADISLIDLGFAELGIPIRLSQAADGAIGQHVLGILHADHACPDLILLDLNMPRVSGFEVLAFIRERGMCARARVIVMTSSGSDRDRDEALTLGAERFISKPDTFEALLVLLKELMTSSASPASSPESPT